MKKIAICCFLLLFCLQPAFAQEYYPRKPKEKKDSELSTRSGQSMFRMLHNAEENLAELREYEVIPPKKKGEASKEEKKGKPSADQKPLKKETDQQSQPEISSKTAEKPEEKKQEAVRVCTVCRSMDHAPDARFCKFCGGRVR